MENKINLIYKLGGDVEGIDVFKLSPILLSVGELLKESNKLANPLGKDIGIQIKPFRQGSFIIDIVLFAQNNLQQIIQFISRDDVRQIKELLEWLGLISGGTMGVIQLVQKLKGKPNKVERISPNEIKYISKDGSEFIVNEKVHKLYNDPTIRRSFRSSFYEPFQEEGISEIKCFIHENDTEQSEIVVTEEEAILFEEFSLREDLLPEETLPKVREEEKVIELLILKAVFEKGRKWDFIWNGIKISGFIEDEKFYKKLSDRNIGIYQGDQIKARVRIFQELNDANLYENKAYKIIEVLDYIQAPIQGSIL
jgi:hypothetical protein